MRAAVYHGARDLRVEEVPDPTPGPHDLILEVHATGICGTDAAEYWDGPFQYPVDEPHPVSGHVGPMIPGHEVAGRVVAVGSQVAAFTEGVVVASGGGISCGTCPPCRQGRTNLCRQYSTIGLQAHGGLAQYCRVPASTCVAVSDVGLSEDTAALAQPMSIAVHSMRQGAPEPSQRALVIGAGGIGAFLIAALTDLGVHTIVADIQPERLTAAEVLGAAQTLRPEDGIAMSEQLAELGGLADVVYEVTGVASALDRALDAAAPGARIVAVGLHDQPRQVDIRRLTLAEQSLVGTMAHICGSDLPEAVRLLAARRDWTDVAPVAIPLGHLVAEGIMPMVEHRATQIKTLVDPWSTETRTAVHAQS